MAIKLRPYQREGVAHILSRPEALLLWPMGAGKTAATLHALTALKLSGEGPALIVGTKNVIVTQGVWQNEAHDLGVGLSMSLVHGGKKFAPGHDVYLTTFDSLHTPEVQKALAHCRVLVLDELTYLKSWGRRLKSLKKHYDSWTHTIGLTGTPIGQSYINLFYQIQSLDGGKTWGKNKQSWRNKNFYATDYMQYNWEPREPEALYQDIAHMIHAVEGPELPPVIQQTIEVGMSIQQTRLYAEMQREFIIQVQSGEVTAANMAVASNKLRQLASGFVYVADGDAEWIDTSRLDVLRETLDVLSSPAIVFYQYQAERDLILDQVIGAETLDSPDAVNRWNRGEIPVLLCHPQSAAHGLNLQFGGHHLIWWSLPWSLDQWQQAQGRLARPGQEADTVFNHVLLSSPVERMMLASLDQLASIEAGFMEWARTS